MILNMVQKTYKNMTQRYHNGRQIINFVEDTDERQKKHKLGTIGIERQLQRKSC